MHHTTPPRPRFAPARFLIVGFLAALLLSLALPAAPTYAAPIMRLRLELAPGTPNPLPSGQPFTVRLTYECSSSIGTDACTDMQVTSTLPAQFEGLQALGNNDVTLATYNPATNTATWNFRSPLPLGTTGQLEFEVRYVPGTTLDGTTGTITANITGTGAIPGGGGIIPPPADANPQPSVTKTLIAGGASDDLSIYRIQVCAGTTGALDLTNTTIVDTLPPGAVYVESTPAGTYNAGAGTVTWSGVIVPASGAGCRFFDVVVRYPSADPQNAIGAAKTNGVGVTTTPLGGVEQTLTTSVSHTLAGPNPQLRLAKTVSGDEGTADTIVSGVVTTRLTVDNIGSGATLDLQGNVTIDNVEIEDPIPAEYAVFAIDTGNAVAVDYQRNGVSTWITGVPLGANVAVTSFPGWNPATDYVSNLRFRFNPLTLLSRSQSVTVLSTIVNPPNGSATPYTVTAAAPRMVPNTATARARFQGTPLTDQDSTATIEVAVPKARPDPRKTIVSGSPALPEGIVVYQLRLRNGAFAPLSEPVIADLLPAAVAYNAGSWTLDQNIAGCAATPAFSATPNFNSSGRTLLLWSWAGTGCSIPADDDARITFSVTVNEGTRAGTLNNRLALVDHSTDPTLVRTSLCAGGSIPERTILSAGGVGDPANYCFSGPSGLTVRAIASVGSAKFVQGQLDTAFSRDPIVGRTVQGGLITYQLELENTGNIDLTNLEIVDILPYRDATSQNLGVRDQAPLGTAWTVQLAGPVTVSPPIPGLTIRYSSELNPCRPTLTADPNPSCTPMADGVTPGPGIWSTQMPSDPTSVRSLKFDFGGYTLLPVQTLRFTFPAFAPVDAPVSTPGPDGIPGNSDDTNVAWNTFAYEATRADDGSTLVAQPPRVGIEVQAPPAGLASYGNYVWHDVNQNGSQEEDTYRGLNGVTVNLYRDADGNPATTADQTLVSTQITRDDVSGDPGYYLFNALTPGFYFAEFERPEGYTVTFQDNAADTIDSDIDRTTLRTPITQLIAGENDLTWDAGFFADTVSLGNRLFYDTNNDGLDNDGAGSTPGSSTGIPGVTVQLFLDEDGNGFLTGNERNWIAETTTDGTGFYLFTQQTRARNGNVLGSPVPLFPAQYLVGIPASNFAGAGVLVGYYSSGTTMSSSGLLAELSAPDPDTGPDGLAGGGDDDRDRDDNGDSIRVIAGDPVPNPFAFYDGGVISKPVFVDSGEPTGEDGSPGTAPGGAPIADGSSNLTVDFGFYTARMGNIVWDDNGSGGGTRADGIRNGAEPGLNGVTVRLLTSAGVEVPVGPDGRLGTADDTAGGVSTAGAGAYSFERLPEGSYRVRITLPAGYVSTRDTADTASPSANTDDQDNGVGSDQTATTATSNSFALDAGNEPAVTTAIGLSDDPTIDFGIVRHYSLGNRVWNDLNNNGTQDAGESGIADVTLRLLQADGVTPAVRIDGANAPNQTTDASGFYRFDLLPAGDYIVEVLASELTAGGDLVGYRTSTNGTPTSGPYEPAPDPDNDTDRDDNGTLSAGVVRSAVVTLGEGSGTAEPTGEAGGGPASAAEAPDTQANRTVDFGFWPTFSLGNRVWDDLDNSGTINAADGASPGLGGLPVRLYRDSNNDGTPDGAAIATTTTSADGYYLFTDLIADTYIVEVVPPAGYRGSTGDLSAYEPGPDADLNTADNDDNGADGAGVVRSAPITLSQGGEPAGEPATPGIADTARDNNANYTVDFGLFLPLSLGNLVWEDADNNGLVNGAEAGIANVTVRLYRDSDNNGTPDGAAIATATTNGTGHYLFTDLGADTYIVEVVNPAGMVSSSGQSLPAPYEPAPDADTVATDDDDNGTRGAGVARSQPVTLTRGGEPTGEPATPGIADTTPDNRANYTVDFGFYTVLSLGNRVWNDLNNNGLINGGELGINGVTMRLYRDNNADGTPDDLNSSGTVTTADAIASVDTAGGGANAGHYLFTNLSAGNYIVEVDSAELTGGGTLSTSSTSTGLTLPAPYEPAPDPDTVATDSDDNGTLGGGVVRSATVTLSLAGEPTGEPATPGFTDAALDDNDRNYTVDFGFYRRLSLGNRVWEDADNSGTVNGAEVGLSGVTVRLYRDADNNGAPDEVDGAPGITTADAIATTTTNGTGHYLFTGLNQSTYLVEVVPPAGYRGSTGDLSAYEPGPDADTIATDNDDNGSDGAGVVRSAPVTLTDGGEPTGEGATPGIADATNDNRSNVTVDFGLFRPLSLGNLVWEDSNNNGAVDGGEAGISGATVRLYRDSDNNGTPDGAAIATATTNGTGHYLFTDLGADTYIVEVVNPAGMVSSTGQTLPAPYEPAPDVDASTADDDDNGTRATGVARSAPITLALGGEPTGEPATPGLPDTALFVDNNANYTVDFGFYTALSLGNRVWEDSNNNGNVDGGEAGVDGVTVRLYRDNNSDGSPDDLNGGGVDTTDAIATTSTAGGGYYLFTDLSAGNYLVEIVAPAGYRSSIGAPVAPGPYEPAPDPDTIATDSDDNGSEAGAVIRSATVTLSVSGEPAGESDTSGSDPTADINSNLTVDFGIYNRVSLGDLVFIDTNNNGAFDAGDSPLEGATVALFESDGSTPAVDGDGNPVAPFTTLADGLYLFANLSPGDYVVRVTPPAGYVSSGDIATSADPNNNANSDDNGVGSNVGGPVASGVVTLTSGGEPTDDGDSSSNSNLSVDFGFFRPVSLGNQVWYDTDNNRRIDGGELGIAGVRVELFYDASGNGTIEDNSGSGGVDETQPVAVETTAADGTYLFTEHTDAAGAPLATPRPLNPGTYVVGIPTGQLAPTGPLSGLFSSGTSAGVDGVLSEITPDDPDAGTMPAIDGDDNGALQAAGFYSGGVLARPVTLSLDGEPTGESPDVDPNPAGRPDASDNQTVDFGFYATSLGNLVWRDDGSAGGVANDGLRNGGEPAIPGVTVRLIAEDGATVLATATTDADGRYLFTGLAEGIYLVEVDRTSAPLAGLDSSRDPANAGTPDAQDNDDNGVTVAAASVRSVPITLDAGAMPTGEADQALATGPGMGDPARADNPATPDASSNLQIDFGFAPADWGDLPDGIGGLPSYRTDRAGAAGPSHTITTGLGIGAAIDAEADGQPSAAADGDDATDDEDGVTLPGFFTGLPAQVMVRVQNSTGRDATLYGFIDFNGDGDFADADEQAAIAAPDGTSGDLTLTFNVPSDAAFSTPLGARFRLSSDTGLGPDGPASDGEVEDYLLSVTPTYSLGNRVWIDRDNSGTINAADGAAPGVDGVTVRLLTAGGNPVTDATGATVADQVTSGGGFYRFDNLPAGDYLVEVVSGNFSGAGALVGTYSSTGAGQETDPNSDGDSNDNGLDAPVAGAIRSAAITLGEGGGAAEPTGDNSPATNPEAGETVNNRSNRTVDFGFISPVSLGDLVFVDVANDGTFDGADTPLAGATVALFLADGTTPATDATGAAVAPQPTGADGRYLFTNLRPGDYVVRVTPPAGYRSSDDLATSANPDTDVNSDDNGVGDSTAGPVSSGVVTLVTGAEPTSDGDSDTSSNLSLDFGFYQVVSLGDLVFADVTNNGAFDGADSPLMGAEVRLFLADGTTPATDVTGAAVALQTTGADGLYRFTNLRPGDYVVQVTPPTGYRSSDDLATSADPDTDANSDDNGVGDSTAGPVSSGVITLVTGAEPTDDGDSDTSSNLSLDFGFYRPLSLGDLIFADVANNGVYDPVIDSPIAGAAVALFFADGTTPATDADDNPVATQTTGADGLYRFTNLKPGRYVVEVDVGAVSGAYRSSTDILGSDAPDNDRNDDDNGLGSNSSAMSEPITLASAAEPTDDGDSDNSSNLSLDFGFFLPAAIGDYVWLDTNRDGVQDDDETGVPGVPVDLYRPGPDGQAGTPDDILVGSTTTEGSGYYLFADLGVGDYFVAFTLPTGYERSPLGGSADPELDSDADPATGRTPITTLGVGENDMSWDAGIFYTASLGDRVWLDRDADGVQGAGEPGVPGVTVELFRADGAPVDTRTTDDDGYYAFTNLPPGDYYLVFTPPAGYERSPQNPAGAPDADSDADPATGRTVTTTISLGENDPSWDAGIYQLVRLGNLVWEDGNNNGVVDGAEAGIPQVAVRLYRDDNRDGAPDTTSPLRAMLTDDNGSYLFDQLEPGSYIVEAVLPSGYVTSTGVNGAANGPFEAAPSPEDSADNDDNGSRAGRLMVRSATVTLRSQDEPDTAADTDDSNGNLTVDFGLFQPAALGSVVWYDTDADGQHQPGDRGVAGVTITLYTSDGQPVRDAAGQPISVVTGEEGTFLFTNLVPGSYQVRFTTLPAGHTFTIRDEGDDGSDSDADRDTGLSQVVTLTAGQTNLTIYAGVLPPTAIELLAFTAEPTADGAVRLRWSTGAELRSAGFHLYRSADGTRAGAVRVTAQLILARGGPMGGADYSWLDTTAQPGQTYSYWLEEVELDGRTHEYGPAVTAAQPATSYQVYLPLVVR